MLPREPPPSAQARAASHGVPVVPQPRLLALYAMNTAPVLRRHVGLLVCQVVQARDIKKMDAFGKADPFVELYTQPTNIQKTARASPVPCHAVLGGVTDMHLMK